MSWEKRIMSRSTYQKIGHGLKLTRMISFSDDRKKDVMNMYLLLIASNHASVPWLHPLSPPMRVSAWIIASSRDWKQEQCLNSFRPKDHLRKSEIINHQTHRKTRKRWNEALNLKVYQPWMISLTKQSTDCH